MYSNFSCRNCSLWKTSGYHVIPENPIEKPIYVLLGQPTLDSTKKSRLKENSTWITILNWLDSVEIDKNNVYFSSLLRCYFDRNKNELASLKGHQTACFNYVIEELKIVKPKVIIALGKDATEFLGGKDFLKNVGKLFESEYGTVISTYTPTYLDRPENKTLIVNVLNHFKNAKELAIGTIIEYEYSYIKTLQEFNDLIQKLDEESVWTFDIEGTSIDFQINELIGIGFSWKRYQGCYLPIKEYKPIIGLQSYWKDYQTTIIGGLRQIFLNDSLKGAQNGKYDWKCLLRECNIDIKNYSIDSLLLASSVSQGKDSYSLDTRSEEYIDLKGYKKDIGDANLIYRQPVPKVALYNNKDTDLTFRIIEDDLKKLEKNEKLVSVFTDIVMPANKLVMRMEYGGIKIDTKYALQFHIEAFNELTGLKSEIEKEVGMKFNIGSPQQLGDILFNRLKLPILDKIGRTKAGNLATGKPVLTELLKITQNPILAKIMRYNSLDSTKGTFIDSFVKQRDRKDNKERDYLLDKNDYFHGNFKLTSATGRSRSGRDDEDTESENSLQLQNIPRDSRFRHLFIPDNGHVFVGADRAQIELRILAHLCQDRELLKACRDDYDLHCFVGSMMLDLAYEDVVKEKIGKYKPVRDLSKNVGFGWVYRAAPGKFAHLFPGKNDIEKKNAEQRARDRYFERFNRILPWEKSVIDEAKKNGFVQSITGRIIYTPSINLDISKAHSKEEEKQIRKSIMHAERQIVNALIQGPASDLTLKAGIDLDNCIIENKLDARMLNFIHDALYATVNPNIVADFVGEMDRLMLIQHFGITAKLKNDIHIWNKWEGNDLTKQYLN